MRDDRVSSGVDQLLYLRVTEACNAYCKHCFIPKNPKRLSKDALLEGLRAFKERAIVGQRVLIQLHGGEPSLLGAQALSEICDFVTGELIDYEVTFGVQTNLLKFDDALIAFYEEYIGAGQFGISWDTDIRHVRSSGVQDNLEFEKIFWANFERVKRTKLAPVVVMTATHNFFQRFVRNESLYDFAKAHGIKELHIEKLTKTGYARSNWSEIGVSNLEHSIGMSEIYAEYLKEKATENPVFTSPFDGISSTIVGLHGSSSGGYGCWGGACDTRFHTIDMHGYKKGCTAVNSEHDNPSLTDDAQVIKIMDFQDTRDSRRQQMCETCRYKSICSSGCLASDGKDGSGECSGHHLLFSAIERSILEGEAYGH